MRRPATSIAVCLGPTVAALLSGCERTAVPTAAPRPPVVTVATPVRKDAPIRAEFTGTTGAVETAEIRARVEGFLVAVDFKDSDDVEAGQVLFVIDPSLYQAEVDRTTAELAQRQAELSQAEWDLKQVEQLAGRGASTEKEVQDRRTARALAAASVQSAEAAVKKAQLDLDYTDVRSPIAGRAGRRLVDIGNLVGAGDRTLLTTVVQMSPMYVYFNISERLLLERLAQMPREQRERPRIPVQVGVANETGYPHEGVIDYVDNTVDEATGTVEVRGVVPNDHRLLFPGAFVRVQVPAGTIENAVLVAEQALGTDLGGKYVLVVGPDDIVEQRPVKIGPLIDGMRVVESGLTGDERYIVNGLQRARPGLPVTPKTQ